MNICSDAVSPICQTSDGIEDTEHFLLFCPSFDAQRRNLLAGIDDLLRPFLQIINLPNRHLVHLLLYGERSVSTHVNLNIIELKLSNNKPTTI